MTFKELNILPAILQALEKEGYTQPTPIQERAIPPVLAGRDLLGCAQTGTGKTAAFAVPILQILSKTVLQQPRKIRSLILTPTRELAVQIFESFNGYGNYLPLRSSVIFGGVPQGLQVQKLKRGVDVLVATPGRLNDLINQGYVDLSHVEIFVLDEADRMLDMGFIQDVKKISQKLPEKRQTLLFSATMPPEISDLVNKILKNPEKITVTPPSTTVDAIEQSVYFVDKENKRNLLIHLLKNSDIKSALVFTRTKHGADRVVRELMKAKIGAAAIHGDKSQNARQLALNNFKRHITRVLVATDIAARGIDIDDLSHVFNYDIPEVPETYVHRIGRTGRAGMSGIAISFCDINEKSDLRNVQKLIGKEIPVVKEHPYPMEILVATPKSQLHGNNRGRRPQQASPRGAQPRQQASQRSAQPRQQTSPRAAQSGHPSSQRPAQARPQEKKPQIQQAQLPMFEKPFFTKPMRHPKIESLTEHGERSQRRGTRDGNQDKHHSTQQKPGYVSHARKQEEHTGAPQKIEPARKRPSDQPLGQTRFSRKG